MAGNKLKIEIDADVSGAVDGFKQVTAASERLDVLRGRLEKLQKVAGSTQDFGKLNKSLELIKKTQAEINSLSKTPMTNLVSGANNATFALTNLSRVVSDAPFGFLGIANNIEPLVQSFISLKAQTGSAGSAFKALLSSLTGAGGLMLGVSLVSSALVLFGDRLLGTGRAAKSAKNETDKFLESLKSSDDIVRESTAESQGQIAVINALSKAVLDETRSQKERLRALNELKSINKEYFGDLTLEEAKLKVLATRVDEYTQALIQNAVVKGFEEEITRVSKELNTQSKELDKLKLKLDQARDAEDGLVSSIEKLRKEGAQSTTISDLSLRLITASKNTRVANSAFVEQRDVVETLQTAMATLGEDIQKAVDGQLKLKDTDPFKEQGEKVKSVNTEIKEQISLLEQLRRAREKAALDDPEKEIGSSKRQDETKSLALPKISKEAQEFTDEVKENLKETEDLANSLANVLTTQLGGAFTDLFSNIATDSSTALQQFGQAIAGIIKKLIAAAITAAIFAAIIGAVTGGASFGAGAKSFLAGFKGLFGQLSGLKFAEGGVVTSPTRGVFGEAGPEAVIPLYKLPSLLQGSNTTNINMVGELGIRGGELIAYIRREDKKFNRWN